jgi:two-component system sensor kinase FixL
LRDGEGGVLGVLGTHMDITDRKQAEAERRASDRKFRAIFDKSCDGIFLLSLDDKKFLLANAACLRMLGYTLEEFRRLDLCDLHAREDVPLVLEQIRRSDEGEEAVRQDVRFLRKDGSEVFADVNPTIVTLNNRRCVLAAVRDVTEHRQTERRQAAMVQRLAAINRELRDFAYVISHDLKALLRAIRTLADWLMADGRDKLDYEGRENLRLLSSRVDRMQSLIDGVLQYSRVGHTEQSAVPVDLHAVASEIITCLGAPAHISIRVENELPTVHGNPTSITQVFQNLLGNAIKYMDKPQGLITTGCAEENGFWKLSVSDNGPGIEARHFERIFKLFQTLERRDNRESTGVGPTITKKIVEMYGGKIGVESEVGETETAGIGGNERA